MAGRKPGPIAVLILLVTLLLPGSLAAHADLRQQIADLTRAIDGDPGNAALYFRRGDLYRLHHDYAAAMADFDRGHARAPAAADYFFLRGRLQQERGDSQAAQVDLDRFISIRPKHAEARIVRAKALLALGQNKAALVEVESALAVLQTASPALYLYRARLQLADDDLAAARKGLADALRRTGPVASLLQLAIDTDIMAGEFDTALGRVAGLPPALAGQARWLGEKGRLLALDGRGSAAADAYRQAMQAIESLPVSRRSSRANQEMSRQFHHRLKQLTVAK